MPSNTKPIILDLCGGTGKGEKHTPEARLKMSLAAKKRVISPEQRERMIAPLRGRKRPACFGLYLRSIHKGKPNPKIAGEKCRFWKGGLTKKNQIIRRSAEYREWREKVFARDGYTCQICRAKGVYIEADHIKPFSEFPDLRFEVANGRTLCRLCHKKTDTYAHKQRWKKHGIVKP